MNHAAEWEIMSRHEWPRGTYFQLNLKSSGRSSSGTITVKRRCALTGPAYVCLTCLTNDCKHIDFVASRDVAAVDGVPVDATEEMEIASAGA